MSRFNDFVETKRMMASIGPAFGGTERPAEERSEFSLWQEYHDRCQWRGDGYDTLPIIEDEEPER